MVGVSKNVTDAAPISHLGVVNPRPGIYSKYRRVIFRKRAADTFFTQNFGRVASSTGSLYETGSNLREPTSKAAIGCLGGVMTVSLWVLDHVVASGLAINALAVGVGVAIGIWTHRRWGERWAIDGRFRISLTVFYTLANIGLVYLSFVLLESHRRFMAFTALALVMMTVTAFMTLRKLHRENS